MLAKWFRLRMINQTGETMTYADGARIAIRLSLWKIVAGAKVDDTVITENLGFGAGTIVDGGEVEGTAIDNTSEKQWGGHGIFETTHDLATGDGVCRLYMEFSDNDGNWPSDSDEFEITDLIQIAVLPIDPDAVDESRSVNFEI